MNQLGFLGNTIAWFANNRVAANLLMLGMIMLGLLSINDIRKEAFPPWPANTVTVSVVYDSGDALLSEEGIAVKIEEALANVQGIKRITSTSDANSSTVRIEKTSTHDLDVLMTDVKNKVDAIYNFPAEAENPVIEKQQISLHAYSIKIYGDTDRTTLQTIAEQLKADLLANSQINNVNILGNAEELLSIEVDEQKLEALGITFNDIREAINAESSSSISTSLRSSDKIIRLKASEQAYYQNQFANIPIITTPQGTIIRLGDVANVDDGFSDRSFVLSRFNGMQGIGLELTVGETGDVINIVEQADKIVTKWQSRIALPENVKIEAWYDDSQLIRDRLSMLIKNALWGIVFVFVVLALFLNLRVAIWVTAGLPFIYCGTLFFINGTFASLTINEISTFGFILALGIVVDDAVVVGESIYSSRKENGDTIDSTIKGTLRVATPTIFGVLTTVAVFVALSNVSGGLGHVYSQFAVIVAICLLLSVVESKLILPSHLSNLNTQRKAGTGWKDSWAKVQRLCDFGLNWFNKNIYQPTIKYSIEYRYAAIVLSITLFISVMSMPFNGAVKVGFFPEIPGSVISANLVMQNDASYGLTESNLLQLESSALEIDRELRGEKSESGIDTIQVMATNDFTGTITVELVKNPPYSVNEFTKRWREVSGIPEGSKTISIESGFGGGDDFRVELKAWDTESLEQAGKRFREYLASTLR